MVIIVSLVGTLVQPLVLHCPLQSQLTVFNQRCRFNFSCNKQMFIVPIVMVAINKRVAIFLRENLGSLIADPTTFALPFWNWDHPNGMKMPFMIYTDEYSYLYDHLREASHWTDIRLI